VKRHLKPITQLLMGAAFADQTLDGRELMAARKLVLQVLGERRLPKELSDIMVEFDPKNFDMEASVSPLRGLPKAAKRKILELIGTINEADDVIDIAEDVYLEAVALSLGLEREEFSDLTLEPLEEDDIAELSDTDLTLIEDA
jgi:uncharacterized tellurite resistance protein B-like protein